MYSLYVYKYSVLNRASHSLWCVWYKMRQ